MLWAEITIGKNNCIYHVGDSGGYIRMLHSKTAEFSLFPHRQQNNDWQESPDIRRLPLTQATLPPTSPFHQPGMPQQPSLQVTLKLMETPSARGQLPATSGRHEYQDGLHYFINRGSERCRIKLHKQYCDSQELNFPCSRQQ